MKKWIGLLAVVAFGTAGSVMADEVDFRAVNPVLQSLLETVTAGDELVDFVYPKFDESYSDLKKERLKYDLQGSMKNTPWLEGGRADVSGSSTYFVDRAEGHTGVGVTMNATVRKTDVLAAIRYSANVVMRRYPDDVDPKFQNRYNAHLKRLAVATSLDQVKALVVSGQALAKDMLMGEIQSQESYLKCLTDKTCGWPDMTPEERDRQIAYYRGYIADLRATLPAYDSILILKEVIDAGGKMIEFSITSEDMSQFIPKREKDGHDFFVLPGKSVARFRTDSLSAIVTAFHKVPLKKLNELKETFTKHLAGAQNGEAKMKDSVQKHYRAALIEFKKTLRGKW